MGKDYYEKSDAPDAINPVNIIKIDLGNMNSQTDGDNSLGIGNSTTSDGAQVDNKLDAQKAIGRIDGAMQKIAGYRAHLGSIQNRLGSTINNLSIGTENLSAAKSRIKDVDFAKETAAMTQSQILQQAGTAVLTQANQNSQIVLSLLG